MWEIIETVALLIVGSGITLCSQIFLKWIGRTEKKNNLIREKLE